MLGHVDHAVADERRRKEQRIGNAATQNYSTDNDIFKPSRPLDLGATMIMPDLMSCTVQFPHNENYPPGTSFMITQQMRDKQETSIKMTRDGILIRHHLPDQSWPEIVPIDGIAVANPRYQKAQDFAECKTHHVAPTAEQDQSIFDIDPLPRYMTDPGYHSDFFDEGLEAMAGANLKPPTSSHGPSPVAQDEIPSTPISSPPLPVRLGTPNSCSSIGSRTYCKCESSPSNWKIAPPALNIPETWMEDNRPRADTMEEMGLI